MVLRITREEGTHLGVTLRLEGSVTGEWVALLEHECSGYLLSCDTVSLDLAGVTFVDRAGVEVLGRLNHAGIEVRCPSGPVASVLEGEGVRVTHDADAVDDGQP